MDKYLKYKKKYLKLKGGMFSFDKDQAFKEPRPLLVQSYSDNFADNRLIDSLNLFELMSSYNRPYEMRGTHELEKSGMYYAQDYIDKYFPGKSTFAITAVANSKYWDIGVNRVFDQTLISYFQSYDYVKPSDALKSFIKGPTITECANTIQISVYHLIYNLIGEEEFDQVFGNLLTPFVVTPTLFN